MTDEGGDPLYPKRFWQAFATPGLAWLILFYLVPLYAVLAVAFGRSDLLLQTPIAVWNPLHWNSQSFGFILSELVSSHGIVHATLLRTFVYVGIAVMLCLLLGYPVAYYVARHGGRLRTLLLVLLIAPFWISYMMRMLAWVNLLQTDGYVNRFLTWTHLVGSPINWLDGKSITVILGLVYGYIPFFVLPLYAALGRIDTSLLEAARDLGASPFRTFLRVSLPLSKQGILAGAVIIALPMFGDYFTPDLLSGSPKTTMVGNLINFFLGNPGESANGAALVVLLLVIVTSLAIYYLISVARASREAMS